MPPGSQIFYVSASDPIKRRIREAFFSALWLEDESHQIRARGEVDEPVALIQEAAAEWAASNAKSFSDFADALDFTPSNLHLRAICSSKKNLVGLVELYSIKSWDANHLRSLAQLKGSRRAEPVRVLPKKAKRLGDAELSAFQARYREGATVAVLAQEFGVHRTTVMAFTKRLDLHRPIRALSDPQIQQAAKMYSEGEPLAVVAKRYGVGVGTEAAVIRRRRAPIHHPQTGWV